MMRTQVQSVLTTARISVRCQNALFFGSDLRRHLQHHVRKNEIEAEGVEQLVAIMATGKRQRGKPERRGANKKAIKKGRFKKWCPVQGCSKVVLNIGRHLTEGKCHGLKKGMVEYNRMVKAARPYTGYPEIKKFLMKPRPDQDSESEEDSQPPEVHQSPEVHSSGSEDSQSDEETMPLKISIRKRRRILSENEEEPVSQGEEHVEEEEEESEASEEEGDGEEEEDEETEDDPDCIPKKETNLEYFTNTASQNFRQRWLVAFYSYLGRPSAGNKKETIKLQHASQMRALLEAVEPGGDDITCLTKYESDAVWQCWVKPMLEENKKKPGTITSYLTSYEKFLKFITNPCYSRFGPPLSHDHRELLALLLPDVKGWRSTVDGQTQDVQNQWYLDEIEGLLTAQVVLQLRSSKPYVEGQKVIKQAGEGKDLTELEFTTARDFLITRFAMDAGSRPGPMNNAKLED